MSEKLQKTFVGLFICSMFLVLVGAKAQANSLSVGQEAPNFKLRDIEGKFVSLAMVLAENKRKTEEPSKVLITFFSMQCKPCMAELRLLKKLQDQYPDNRTTVILIVLADDRQEELASRAHVADLGLKAVMVLDMYQIAAKRYGVKDKEGFRLPATFIVSSEQKIMHVWSGFQKEHVTALFKPVD